MLPGSSPGGLAFHQPENHRPALQMRKLRHRKVKTFPGATWQRRDLGTQTQARRWCPSSWHRAAFWNRAGSQRSPHIQARYSTDGKRGPREGWGLPCGHMGRGPEPRGLTLQGGGGKGGPDGHQQGPLPTLLEKGLGHRVLALVEGSETLCFCVSPAMLASNKLGVPFPVSKVLLPAKGKGRRQPPYWNHYCRGWEEPRRLDLNASFWRWGKGGPRMPEPVLQTCPGRRTHKGCWAGLVGWLVEGIKSENG